ncbi:hypothetical protein D3C86_1465110 [compost metagenome]
MDCFFKRFPCVVPQSQCNRDLVSIGSSPDQFLLQVDVHSILTCIWRYGHRINGNVGPSALENPVSKEVIEVYTRNGAQIVSVFNGIDIRKLVLFQ